MFFWRSRQTVVARSHGSPTDNVANAQGQDTGIEVEKPAQPLADEASYGVGIDQPRAFGDQLEREIQP